MTLLDLSPADFRRFLAVFVDRRLMGSHCCLSTGLVANGIRLTKRCNALSSRSDVTRGLPDLGKSFTLLVCVFSHLSADYSIVVAHLTSKFEMTSLLYAYRLFAIIVLLIFAFVSCLLRMNTFFKTPNLNTQIRSVNILNFE